MATPARESFFERVKAGLEEAIQHFRGEITLRVIEVPSPPPACSAAEILALRRRLNVSQTIFGALLNVSYKTVQSWEQGERTPSHAALRLLQVASESPDSVFRAGGLNPVELDRTSEGGTKSRVANKARKPAIRSRKGVTKGAASGRGRRVARTPLLQAGSAKRGRAASRH